MRLDLKAREDIVEKVRYAMIDKGGYRVGIIFSSKKQTPNATRSCRTPPQVLLFQMPRMERLKDDKSVPLNGSIDTEQGMYRAVASSSLAKASACILTAFERGMRGQNLPLLVSPLCLVERAAQNDEDGAKAAAMSMGPKQHPKGAWPLSPLEEIGDLHNKPNMRTYPMLRKLNLLKQHPAVNLTGTSSKDTVDLAVLFGKHGNVRAAHMILEAAMKVEDSRRIDLEFEHVCLNSLDPNNADADVHPFEMLELASHKGATQCRAYTKLYEWLSDGGWSKDVDKVFEAFHEKGNKRISATLPVTKLFEEAFEEDLSHGSGIGKLTALRGICAKNALETSSSDATCPRSHTSWRNMASFAWGLWVKLPDNKDAFNLCLNASADYLHFSHTHGPGQSKATHRVIKMLHKVPSEGVDKEEVRREKRQRDESDISTNSPPLSRIS